MPPNTDGVKRTRGGQDHASSVYVRSRSIGSRAFVVDLWPRSQRSLGLVERTMMGAGLQPTGDFALVETNQQLVHMILRPWNVRYSKRSGLLDQLVRECDLDDARVRRVVNRDADTDSPTRLVARCALAPSVDKSAHRFEQVVSVCHEAFDAVLREPEGHVTYLGVPMGPRTSSLFAALVRMGWEYEFERVSTDCDFVLTVTPDLDKLQVRVRAPRSLSLVDVEDSVRGCLDTFMSIPDVQPVARRIYKTDTGAVGPDAHLDHFPSY